MSKHRDRLETPTIDEEPTTPTVPDTGSVEVEPAETEPLRESVDTVRGLLEAWKVEYDQAETQARKNELAYRMVRMDQAIQAAHLSSDEVKIREAEPGVLGFYVPGTGEIAITTAGLALDPVHFKDVLVHEATHAGKLQHHRISDEGLTQIKTRRRVPGAMHGIYESEQSQNEKTFATVGIERVLDTYDFDNPRELIDLYLSAEWDDEWKKRWQVEFDEEVDLTTESGRKDLLEGPMKEWLATIEENFQEATPRLFSAAEQQGFDFTEAHVREFSRVVAEQR